MAEFELFDLSHEGFALLHDEPPFQLVPQETTSNNLIYSGPTITEIETALLASNNTPEFSSLDRLSHMERAVSRVENKYILKIKSSGNVMADDGYKWRKYGQKSIKNSSNPRSYYKCTNPRCGAKKQVERSNDEVDTLIITYEGLHLHYTYPFFIFGQSENSDPPTKKFRRFNFESVLHQRAGEGTKESIQKLCLDQPTFMMKDTPTDVEKSSQGLLEDMVPLRVRNPMINMKNSSISPSSSFSLSHFSPPSSPSFSWSPKY